MKFSLNTNSKKKFFAMPSFMNSPHPSTIPLPNFDEDDYDENYEETLAKRQKYSHIENFLGCHENLLLETYAESQLEKHSESEFCRFILSNVEKTNSLRNLYSNTYIGFDSNRYVSKIAFTNVKIITEIIFSDDYKSLSIKVDENLILNKSNLASAKCMILIKTKKHLLKSLYLNLSENIDIEEEFFINFFYLLLLSSLCSC